MEIQKINSTSKFFLEAKNRYINVAEVYKNLGKMESAITSLEEASVKDPKDVRIKFAIESLKAEAIKRKIDIKV